MSTFKPLRMSDVSYMVRCSYPTVGRAVKPRSRQRDGTADRARTRGVGDPWNFRQLCDDGACTGVIGADGRCHVCGRAARNWGDERRRGMLDEDEAERETAAHVATRATIEAPSDFE